MMRIPLFHASRTVLLAIRLRFRPSVAAAVREHSRKKPDDLVPIIEDLIKLLDDVGESLRRGRHPDRAESRKVASVLRAVATDLES